jgi:hypothetical protein
VRKRLGLYYYDSTHNGELVIELPIGSYLLPVFRQSGRASGSSDSSSRTEVDQPPQGIQVVAPALPVPSLAYPMAAAQRHCRTGVARRDQHWTSQHPAPRLSRLELDKLLGTFLSSTNRRPFVLVSREEHQYGIAQYSRCASSQAGTAQQLYVRLHLSGNTSHWQS